MAIVLSTNSVWSVLTTLYMNECFALGESSRDLSPEELQQAVADQNNATLPSGELVRNVTSAYVQMTSRHDESFIRLYMEQLLKVGTPQDFFQIMDLYEFDEAKEELGHLYTLFWGPLPDGPPPIVRIVRTELQGQIMVTNHSRYWSWMREAVYGRPPYDYAALRKLAMEPLERLPEIPEFPNAPLFVKISGNGWTAEPDGARIKLIWQSGARVPYDVSMHIPPEDLAALMDGAEFHDIVVPLFRTQSVQGKGWTAEPNDGRITLTWLSGAHTAQELSVHIPANELAALIDSPRFDDVVVPLMRAQNVKAI